MQLLIAELPGAEFVDICEATRPATFAGRPDIYNDANHLNASGAAIFSTLLADELGKRRLGGETSDWLIGGGHPLRR
jgi:hypothetical protein